MRIHAKDREEISEAGPGDIVALVGLKLTKTGDTLCDPAHPLHLESITVPATVIEMKILPSSRKDQSKLGEALHKLSNEDPSFNVRYDEETEETIIAGMGELHLEIIIDRLKHEFGVEVDVSEPAVAYRETITSEVEASYRYSKQTGGKGQFAETHFRIEPNEGNGYEFVDRIKGGAIPTEFVPSVNKGITKTLEKGVLAGFPVVDVKVVLHDGKFHPVDSSDMAFQTCASICFKEGFMKAHPILLEPIMKVECTTPDEYQGDLVGDISRRRGAIQNIDSKLGQVIVSAHVPLAEMFGYATAIRSLSKGRASYSMEPFSFEQVPNSVAEKILDSAKSKPAART
jgi:elongation factor G